MALDRKNSSSSNASEKIEPSFSDEKTDKYGVEVGVLDGEKSAVDNKKDDFLGKEAGFGRNDEIGGLRPQEHVRQGLNQRHLQVSKNREEAKHGLELTRFLSSDAGARRRYWNRPLPQLWQSSGQGWSSWTSVGVHLNVFSRHRNDALLGRTFSSGSNFRILRSTCNHVCRPGSRFQYRMESGGRISHKHSWRACFLLRSDPILDSRHIESSNLHLYLWSFNSSHEPGLDQRIWGSGIYVRDNQDPAHRRFDHLRFMHRFRSWTCWRTYRI